MRQLWISVRGVGSVAYLGFHKRRCKFWCPPTSPNPTSPNPTSPNPTLPNPTLPNPTSPNPTSPNPHFAKTHFAESHFAESHFAESHLYEWKKDDLKYYIVIVVILTPVSYFNIIIYTNAQSQCSKCAICRSAKSNNNIFIKSNNNNNNNIIIRTSNENFLCHFQKVGFSFSNTQTRIFKGTWKSQ